MNPKFESEDKKVREDIVNILAKQYCNAVRAAIATEITDITPMANLSKAIYDVASGIEGPLKDVPVSRYMRDAGLAVTIRQMAAESAKDMLKMQRDPDAVQLTEEEAAIGYVMGIAALTVSFLKATKNITPESAMQALESMKPSIMADEDDDELPDMPVKS